MKVLLIVVLAMLSANVNATESSYLAASTDLYVEDINSGTQSQSSSVAFSPATVTVETPPMTKTPVGMVPLGVLGALLVFIGVLVGQYGRYH